MNKTAARLAVITGNDVAINSNKITLTTRGIMSDYDLKRVQYPADRLLAEHPYAVIDGTPASSGLGMNFTHHYGAMFFKDFKSAWDYATA
jgi:predicted oxidoreductase